MDTSGIVGDGFLSWPVSAQRAELDKLQHILDRTRECLNLDGTDDEFSFEDQDQWDQATPEPFSASTSIISRGVEDDGQGMPDLTPITPFSAGLYTGQGMVPMVMKHPQLVFQWNTMLNVDFEKLPKGYLKLQGLVLPWQFPTEPPL